AGQLETLQLFGDASVALEARQAVRREREVFAQCHVRKERVVLKNVSAGAALRRQANARDGIEKNAVVEDDASAVGSAEAGDGIESQRFTGAAGSVKRGDAGSGF